MKPALTPVYDRILDHAGMWSAVIGRGKTLRITTLEAGANVGVLLYNADLTVERYNMPDTLKGQHIFYLRPGCCLHSDMGRVLASITGDSVGWHDTVCGGSDAALVAEKYGARTYQEAGNEFRRNARDCFLIELGKWGLGSRDLVAHLNLFSKVVADDRGSLSYVAGHAPAGSWIDLRLDMNALVVLNTCQHPLDPELDYHPRQVRLQVADSPFPGPDDACRCSCPENARAFTNTESYCALRREAPLL